MHLFFGLEHLLISSNSIFSKILDIDSKDSYLFFLTIYDCYVYVYSKFDNENGFLMWWLILLLWNYFYLNIPFWDKYLFAALTDGEFSILY